MEEFWRMQDFPTSGTGVVSTASAYRVNQFPAALLTAEVEFLACPSDSNGNKSFQSNFDSNTGTGGSIASVGITSGRTCNYMQSLGDFLQKTEEWGSGPERATSFGRGPIQPSWESTMADISDGTSNTAIFSERGAGDGTEESTGGSILSRVIYNTWDVLDSPNDAEDHKRGSHHDVAYGTDHIWNPQACLAYAQGRTYVIDATSPKHTTGWGGTQWYNGVSQHTWCNFILPPNSPSCTSWAANVDPRVPALTPPTSYHTAGVNVALADGSVIFVSDVVDAGNLTGTAIGDNSGKAHREGPSNFGVWGSFGSRNGGEPTGQP
jgi:hypothetical protein